MQDSFIQMEWCKPIANLLTFQWQIFRWALHSLVPEVQTLTARTYHATSIEWNHSHFFNVPKQLFFQELSLWGTDSRMVAYLNKTILISSNQEFIIIYLSCHHNLQLLLPYIHILHLIRSYLFVWSSLSSVTFASFTGWNLVKNHFSENPVF